MYALTAKGTRRMDEYAAEVGISGSVLMENAGKSVVSEITEKFSDKMTKVLVLCGPGNNGGDALCTARWLKHTGYDVSVYFVGDDESVSREFSRQLHIMYEMFGNFAIAGIDSDKDIRVMRDEYDVIVDGIFGIGLNRRLGYNFVKFIEYINTKKGYKIAIDIPSGLNATTGNIMEAAFIADETITFGSYKTGMFFGSGRDVCGNIKVKDIGIPHKGYRTVRDKLLICDREFFKLTEKNALIQRSEISHKGTFGTVGVVVGSAGMIGASMLATKAAYRAGCGLVKIFCPNKFTGFFSVSIPEAVVVPYKNDNVIGGLNDFFRGLDAVLIGPGLSEDSTGRLLLKQILFGDIPAVIDAGALNIISKNTKMFRRRTCRCVITPHIGEMARLCGEDIETVKKNRIGFTRKFSEMYDVSMVLKSDVSLISLVSGKIQKLYLNITGNSGLATAGSGDVLAGVITSLIAQGNSMNVSLLYGVMIHGLTAEKLATDEDSKRRMMAGDIADNLF